MLAHACNLSTQEREADGRESRSAWIRTQNLPQKQTNKNLYLCAFCFTKAQRNIKAASRLIFKTKLTDSWVYLIPISLK